jgi:hypothetical protein
MFVGFPDSSTTIQSDEVAFLKSLICVEEKRVREN